MAVGTLETITLALMVRMQYDAEAAGTDNFWEDVTLFDDVTHWSMTSTRQLVRHRLSALPRA